MVFSTEIYHHGVKGQKWGHRKTRPLKGIRYSTAQRAYDKQQFGKRSVHRIEKRMLKGRSLEGARNDEAARKKRIQRILTFGVSGAMAAVGVSGAIYAQSILNRTGYGAMLEATAKLRATELGISILQSMLK